MSALGLHTKFCMHVFQRLSELLETNKSNIHNQVVGYIWIQSTTKDV
jgi:hypothetical protein